MLGNRTPMTTDHSAWLLHCSPVVTTERDMASKGPMGVVTLVSLTCGQEPAIFVVPPEHVDMPTMWEVVRTLRLDLLLKLGLSILLGGIVGFERELAGKPAGLRTNILICLGAALLMDVSTRIGLVDG